jgi:hypothetical protein
MGSCTNEEGANCSRVWTEFADCPLAFVAVKVNVHCVSTELEATVALAVPVQLTVTRLLPDQNAGLEESEQAEAFADE